MGLFKIAFFIMLALLAGIGVFIGAVMILTSLQNGAVSLSYTVDGRAMTETITRAGDSARFWRLLTMMGFAPVVIGSAALWYSVRYLRS